MFNNCYDYRQIRKVYYSWKARQRYKWFQFLVKIGLK